ncbi:hypothetical protein T07_1202 [Trichinella nelsoni]|uniref:Uncharacterized protein n=1 Tax=Trichinella nelsoni TaxID=6336 RepID=A0A0V0RDB7_9BILA|nr:hypothetical protein T07_1202 [Trichinella nelsoni]
MDVISGLFWLLNLLQCCDGSCANVQTELLFTNGSICTTVNINHPEISRHQNCRNPPIAVAEKIQCHAMGKVEVADLQWFPLLSKTMDLDPVFYKATKLPDPKSPSIDCVIVLRKLCYAMGKVEVADLQWFPLSQTIDLGGDTRVFHKYTKLPGSKARSVDCFIVQI